MRTLPRVLIKVLYQLYRRLHMPTDTEEVQIYDSLGNPVTVEEVYIGQSDHPDTGEPTLMPFVLVAYQEGSKDDPAVEPVHLDVPAYSLKAGDGRHKTLIDHLSKIYQEQRQP
jgi:hypothetical protein